MATTKTRQGITREIAREQLKIAAWQLDLALTEGILLQHPDGSITGESIAAANSDRSRFRTLLEGEYRLTGADAARQLSCSMKDFRRLAAEHSLHPVAETRGKHGKVLHYRSREVTALIEKARPKIRGRDRGRRTVSLESIAIEYKLDINQIVQAAREINARVERTSDGDRTISAAREPDLRLQLAGEEIPSAAHRRTLAAEAADVTANVSLKLRSRKDRPASVTLHLGPTNSGKTYDALNRLAASGQGVYAAPLRMLAREAFQKMVDRVGPDRVGLITGEEQINPEAPILCCTAEMAPMSGTTLVVDEAHWASDPDRGYAWTRLLIGGAYEHVEVAANRGAEPFLRSVLADADYLNVEYHSRLSPLIYAGQTPLADIPAGSLLVAFSRKAVHALAQRLIATGRTVGVLYGALPPETRTEQIQQFMNGQVEILVCTDVIGHGINSPAKAVVIAQTNKFDGHEVRDLLTWERAQISGRAGRYGHAGSGEVYTLRDEPGFTPDHRLVQEGAAAAAGSIPDGLHVSKGLLRPTFNDLGEPEAHQIGLALTVWAGVAVTALADRDGVEAVPITPIWERWSAIGDLLRSRIIRAGLATAWPLDGSTAWQVITTPVDLDSPALPALVTSLAENTDRFESVLQAVRFGSTGSLEAAEAASSTARDLMVVARMFPNLRPSLWDEASALERISSRTISSKLSSSLRSSSFGVCGECRESCPPHFSRCDRCHAGRMRSSRAA